MPDRLDSPNASLPARRAGELPATVTGVLPAPIPTVIAAR